MIDIIPNWHPIAVHFPIALFCTSALLFSLGLFLNNQRSKELFIASRWCLWGAAFAATIAALLGWQAYNTVAHDELSHAAMTLHKNWAIPTAVYITMIALFAYFIRREWGEKKKAVTLLFLVIGSGIISITGWLGAEAVYRHGIGVMRVPDPDNHNHTGSKSHGPSEGKNQGDEHHPAKIKEKEVGAPHDDRDHAH